MGKFITRNGKRIYVATNSNNRLVDHIDFKKKNKETVGKLVKKGKKLGFDL